MLSVVMLGVVLLCGFILSALNTDCRAYWQDTWPNESEHKDTQHNGTQFHNKNATPSITLCWA